MKTTYSIVTEDILLGTPLCITFLIVMVCSSKCIPPMIPWKTPITPQFKSQLLPSHCSSILKLRFCITFENLFINYLKPCQNKKGQSFVVMLGFCMSFFLICKKKDMQKPSIEHRNKRLVVLITYFVRALVCFIKCFGAL